MKPGKSRKIFRYLLNLTFLGLLVTGIAIGISNSSQPAHLAAPALAQSINNRLLTSNEANDLPVVNLHSGDSGCYVACYSDRPGMYRVEDIWIHGLIRVPGRYSSSSPPTCNPDGYEDNEIRPIQEFKTLCNQNLEDCEDCWAVEDTGEFFN